MLSISSRELHSARAVVEYMACKSGGARDQSRYRNHFAWLFPCKNLFCRGRVLWSAHGCRRSACLGMTCLSAKADWLPKTWNVHHPSTLKIQVVNLRALNPQYPKQCHKNLLLHAGLRTNWWHFEQTREKKTGRKQIHAQTVCWEHNAQGHTKRNWW